MTRQHVGSWAVAALTVVMGVNVWGADLYKLPTGTPELQSAGPLTFGPDGILLIGDTKAAAIVAIQTGDKSGTPATAKYNIEDLGGKIAAAIKADAPSLTVRDLAVNPASGNVYVSLSVAGKPGLVRVNADGQIQQVSLKDVPFSRAALSNAPEDQAGPRGNPRDSSITDIAWVDGQVIVSGTTNAKSPTNLRALSFPFSEANEGASLEIYHAAHAKTEDNARIRTFVPFVINGKPNLLAGFVCTPLVQFPLDGLTPGEKVKGKTVAELGNRNQPLDMIVYKKDGQSFLLLSNSARGVMKISTADIEKNQGLTTPVSGGGAAGQPYETIAALAGVDQLDKLNDDNVVVLIKDGSLLNLKSVALP
jgi:hypothetical protein